MSRNTKKVIGRVGLGLIIVVPSLFVAYLMVREAIRDFGLFLVPICGVGVVIVLLIGILSFWAFPEVSDD